MLREERARGAAFALDRPGQTLRRAAFAGYKASRPAAPTPLGQQVGARAEVLRRLRLPGLRGQRLRGRRRAGHAGRASCARPARRCWSSPAIWTCSSARSAPTRVHAVGRGTQGRTYDEAAVWSRFGVAPHGAARLEGAGRRRDRRDPRRARRRRQDRQRAGAPLRQRGRAAGPGGRGGVGVAARDASAGLTTELPLWRDLTRLHDDVPLPEGPRWAALDGGGADNARTSCSRSWSSSRCCRGWRRCRGDGTRGAACALGEVARDFGPMAPAGAR